MPSKSKKEDGTSLGPEEKDQGSEKGNRTCEEEDCDKPAERWTISIWDDEEEDFREAEHFLCPEHAADHGFCLRCGGFYGGVESYEFTGLDGFCSDCSDVIKQEFGEVEDPGEWPYPKDFPKGEPQ